MAAIKSHEDLVAWQLSDELEDRVYEITARSSARKDRDFCDDIQRSGRSAPANLSEAFHRFRPREMSQFARIAIGSLGETVNHLRHAKKRKYITDQEFEEWSNLANRARRASIKWKAYLDSCPPEGPGKQSRTKRHETSTAEPAPTAEPTANAELTPNHEPRTPNQPRRRNQPRPPN